MINSLTLSKIESKKPPRDVAFLVNLAIAPSIPSKIPVKKIKIEKTRRFENKMRKKVPAIEHKIIINVARFGVIPILFKVLAKNVIRGRNNFLKRNREGILVITLLTPANI